MGTRTNRLTEALDASGNQIVGGLGVSLTMPGEASDYAQPRHTLAADWIGIRYIAVDYDSGSDTAVGYSDTSLADAGTKAIKTIEELLTRIPQIGQGQKLVVAIKTRSGGAVYLKKDGATQDSLKMTVSGYGHVLVRGTGDVATAGATAFANDTADKIACGAQIVSGTNAGGYNPTGSIAASGFDVQLAGGGAPGLAAEPGLIGKRMRFSSTTTTVALRNVCRMIHANDTDTLTPADDWPAVAVGTDVLYIEEPGVAVFDIALTAPNAESTFAAPSFAIQGVHFVGFRSVDTGSAALSLAGTCQHSVAFIDAASTSFTGWRINNFADVRIQKTYIDETGTSVDVGVSIRMIGGITCSRGINFIFSSGALIGPAGVGRIQILNVGQYTVGAGSYMFIGILVQGSGGAANSGGNVFTNSIGKLNSATARRLRILAPSGSTAGIGLSMSSCAIYGVDITGMGTAPLISVRGTNLGLAIADVVGTTGNTGSGVDLTLAHHCTLVMGVLAANTFAGTAGRDIQGAGGGATTGPFYVHADYSRTDLTDDRGNRILGTAGRILGTAVIATNDGNADIGQYKIVRPTASGAVRAAFADVTGNAIAAGVTQSAMTAAGPQVAILANGGGTWVQFDAAPTAGNVAYLSNATAGNAMDTLPTLLSATRKLRLGRILRVSGTLGYINWNPEIVSVLADGLA